MEYLWGSGLFSTSDFALFFFLVPLFQVSCNSLYYFCTINLARTTVTIHYVSWSLAWAWNKHIHWECHANTRTTVFVVCVTNELPRLFHPQRTQFTDIRSEAQSTILTVIIIMKCVVVFICTISLARAILMFETRRGVYLHDKSCACYTNVWNASWCLFAR